MNFTLWPFASFIKSVVSIILSELHFDPQGAFFKHYSTDFLNSGSTMLDPIFRKQRSQHCNAWRSPLGVKNVAKCEMKLCLQRSFTNVDLATAQETGCNCLVSSRQLDIESRVQFDRIGNQGITLPACLFCKVVSSIVLPEPVKKPASTVIPEESPSGSKV